MMKRFTSILLALLLTAGVFVSCGNTNEDETKSPESNAVETNNEETNSTEPGGAETNGTETNGGETDGTETNGTETNGGETTAADAKKVLDSVYDSFLDKLAPAFGAASGEEISGYFASLETETVTEVDPDSGEEFSYEMPLAGPGAIDLSNIDNLYMTLLPGEWADKLNSAALFFNMMNQNNGTFAAFSLKDAADADAAAEALKNAITGNQWMCGFPERVLIVNVDGVIVSAFGIGDATNALKDALTETYASASVLYDEALAG